MTQLEATETPFLKFIEMESISKTKRVQVISKRKQVVLGEIKWYGPWRQYCFFPNCAISTVFNRTCLSDIESVIKGLQSDWRKKQNDSR